MKKITRSALVEMLKSLPKSNTFVGVTMTTVPRMRKTNNPWFGRVRKTSTVTGCVHYNYESNVNAQREREGKPEDFVIQAPSWGERVGDTCIIEHKGKLYIDLRVLRCLRNRYFADGTRISKDTIDAWLQKSGPSKKQDLKKDVVVRRPEIVNLRRINVNKERYEVIDG